MLVYSLRLTLSAFRYKVYRFDQGTAEIVCVVSCLQLRLVRLTVLTSQYGIRVVWRTPHVVNRIFPTYDEYSARRSGVCLTSQVDSSISLYSASHLTVAASVIAVWLEWIDSQED